MTVQNVLDTLTHYPTDPPEPKPAYRFRDGPKVALSVPSMAGHMSDEGWQLMLALRSAGYDLKGPGGNVRDMLKEDPAVVFVQDQHEWDSGGLAKKEEFFHGVEALAERDDVFKLTVVKDTHRQWESARDYGRLIGCHAWVIYYHPAIVLRTLSWLRPEHLIRTWHSVDRMAAPPFVQGKDRGACLLSGSMGGAYPLRERIHAAGLPNVSFLRHPGYHNTSTNTNGYLKTLSKYKVAICTASRFGYALRKIIEATACGCRVITNLPEDDELPFIDDNLVRVLDDIPMDQLRALIDHHARCWDEDRQRYVASWAIAFYDYRNQGRLLAKNIEKLRKNYGGPA